MHDPSEASTVDLMPPNRPRASEPPRPFSSRVQVDVAALSDRGKVRADNEDHFLVARFGRSLEVCFTNLPEGEVPRRSEEAGYALVVADGLGGMAAGEQASRLAIQTLVNLLLDTPDWILRLDDALVEEVKRRVLKRYRQVDNVLAEQGYANAELHGMRTTMTVALSLGVDVLLIHVGDSRAYVFRQGRLIQLTHDHTMAQALADRGHITQEEVPTSGLRHVLTQALGGGKGEAKPEIQRLQLADGDCLLLCTDGLTGMVEDAQIAEALGRGENAEPTCQRLISLALERGGRDNVTILVARYRVPPAD
jgi:PPM family protein phosphatase